MIVLTDSSEPESLKDIHRLSEGVYHFLPFEIKNLSVTNVL